MYVCGIMFYDVMYLGYVVIYVMFDLIYWLWLDFGYELYYVQNIIDIDDLLFECVDCDGVDWCDFV